jgi:hypothetical protein
MRRRPELHLHVQLRRLAHRHRQPARVQPALQHHRRPLPLRHHVLPPPHGPVLRRPPRRRLPRCVKLRHCCCSRAVPEPNVSRSGDVSLCWLYAAQAFGLPLLPPYLPSQGKDLRQGVNFAVGGATAMDPPFFEEIGASDNLWTNLSLSVQLGWFNKIKPSLCNSTQSPCLSISLAHSLPFRFCILGHWIHRAALLIANFCLESKLQY